MTSLNSLKREVEILHKALGTQDSWKEQSEQIQKLLFFNEKVIELSRHPDDKALLALNLEIAAFNEAHPPTPEDMCKITGFGDQVICLQDMYNEVTKEVHEKGTVIKQA